MASGSNKRTCHPGLAGQVGQQRGDVGRVQVVNQQPHPHAARHSVAQLTQQGQPGTVGVQVVALAVKCALGGARQGEPGIQRSPGIGRGLLRLPRGAC